MIRTPHALGAALALAAAVQCGSAAQAQTTGLLPFRAKIGGFFPQGSGKDFAGSTTFIVEADASLPNLSAGKVFLSAGYLQGSDNGNKMRVIPLTIGRYFSPPNPLAGVTGNVYGGVGAGAYLVRASTPTSSDSKATIGGFGVVGYQFPSKLFVEAKYHIAGRVNGARPGGLAVMIGRSF